MRLTPLKIAKVRVQQPDKLIRVSSEESRRSLITSIRSHTLRMIIGLRFITTMEGLRMSYMSTRDIPSSMFGMLIEMKRGCLRCS
jgi:hypothetical protein